MCKGMNFPISSQYLKLGRLCSYLPYCFFNILSPIMSVIVAALNYKIFKKQSVSSAEQ